MEYGLSVEVWFELLKCSLADYKTIMKLMKNWFGDIYSPENPLNFKLACQTQLKMKLKIKDKELKIRAFCPSFIICDPDSSFWT